MRNCLITASLPVLLALSAPASAQSLAELDRLSDLTEEEDSGIAAAQEQAQRGAYLEALATLERVMAAHPRSAGARLLHAVYLCRIDDRQGGLVEIDQMDEDLFGEANIADARERCSRPYVEPQAVAPPPPPEPEPAPAPAPAPIEAVALPPSTAAEGKPQPAPPAAEPAPPASGSNTISGSNSINGTAAPRSSSSSASQQPATTAGGEKD